jgi:HK97 family phage major capsid protein
VPTDLKDYTEARTTKLRTIVAELDDITTGAISTEEKGELVMSEAAAARFRELITEQKGIRDQLNDVEQIRELKSFLDATPGSDSGTAGGLGGSISAAQLREIMQEQRHAEHKSVGQRFIDSTEFKERDRGTGIMRSPFELAAGEDLIDGGVERKDIYTSAGGTLTSFAFGTPQREPIVPRPYRTARVRDLFPVASTTANLIEYVRVLGYLDGANNAAPVPERDGPDATSNFGLKPHTSLSLQPAQSPLRTIAHYELAHRNTLADEPQLRSIIDTELLYGLRLIEDAQLLNGDGTGENILGLLKTPGIQNYPGTPIPSPSPVLSTDTYIDAVRRAATRVMLAYYEPTGVVVHPFDWERMELQKDLQGRYLITVSVAVGAQKQIWQMPVVSSPAIAQGTALVGAFGLGAKVYDREQANIRVAEQHADLFIRNAVAILAEERVGLTVSRPESFIKIDLPTGSAA